jgi:hypothetical protein
MRSLVGWVAAIVFGAFTLLVVFGQPVWLMAISLAPVGPHPEPRLGILAVYFSA